MFIGSTADTSMHVARSRIRQRELLHSSRILSSGNKFEGTNGQVSDLGGHSFSSGMQARLKTEEAAKGNIQHALSFVQTQSDGLKTVARILSRMEELAYHSTDSILSENDRRNLDIEFGALKQSLSGISSEKQFGTKLFDPLAARYEGRFPVLGVSDGGWETQEQTVDIGAKRGKIHLWWNPTWQTDRMKVYHGSNMIFDSGEYRTTHLLPGGREFGGFDNFTIEFGSNTKNSTSNANNTGVSLHDKDVGTEFPAKTTQGELNWYLSNQPPLLPVDYKKFKTNDDYPKIFGSPYGDTEIKFVVNEKENVPGGFPFTRQAGSSTIWEYKAEIEKSNLTDQSVLVDSEGGTLELNAVGFSDLSHLTVNNARLAVSSLDTLSEELGNIRYQMGVMAGEIAAFEARLDVLNGKTYHEKIALDNTTGVDIAKEVTHMAKNQILESATSRAMLHSRLSTERVLDLIL